MMNNQISNYSILTQNTLGGLSETAGALYLNLLDKYCGHDNRDNELRAFREACRYDDAVGSVLERIFKNCPLYEIPPERRKDLSTFFAARWQHNFLANE